ncbi:hypothetical protein APY04_2806 [Hyphomicrobium sulfonivorans]|uniref:Mobile element protein n=1 Tax=Hyphomicrobium sulfonivorans TaxID=121290 RepID=A0A109BB88_HYPSL|nr:hypothetical protein APY04_2806 [Hyphomicrobium sulfonivorans]
MGLGRCTETEVAARLTCMVIGLSAGTAGQASQRKCRSPTGFVHDIRRATRKRYSAEEEIRIVIDGLRGEVSIA